MFIYMILNTVNQKVYVGQTTRKIQTRWNQHRRELRAGIHKNSHLQRAWKKYGESAFEFKQLYEASSPDELNHREEYFISYLDAAGDAGYNRHLGGTNRTVSEETRRKISEAGKQWWINATEEEKAGRLSKSPPPPSQKGKPQSKESKEKKRKACKAAYAALSEEEKERRRLTRVGVNPLANLTSKQKADRARKISNAHKGKKKPPRTKAHRRALSIATKKRYAMKKRQMK